MTNALARVRSGYRPSAGRAMRRMNHSRARPPTTPATRPTLICRTNPAVTDSTLPAVIPPAANNATIRAMPTGSFAPDSPSRMSPLRPATSRRPSTENTTAGSVGEIAAPSRAARYQSSPNAQCASTAAAAAVRNVPATPITAIGAADRRNRDQPRCMPPSNRMHSNATVTTRSTSCSGGDCRSGTSLVAAAATTRLVPDLQSPPEQLVERVVTVALLCILFDGGMHLGWSRFRRSAAPIAVIGVAGTFLTAAAAAVLAHWAFGLDWYLAALLGTAVSPTDPAVVFSVLGRREVAGRSGDILEGESGANDPVGIALMVALLAAGGITAGSLLTVTGQFVLQMSVGVVVGIVGGRGLLWFMRRVALPAEGLYPLRTLASAFVIYGVASVAHGSGFLAVFITGIILGDARAPFKREIERFHSALAR